MIYTSYFSNIRTILDLLLDAGLVSIAGKTPESLGCARYEPLMPKYSWWREWHDKFTENLESKESRDWYIEKYYKTVLLQLSPREVARDLKDLVNWRPTFILCYETPEKFCHRHIVAEWFNNYHISCEEWKAR